MTDTPLIDVAALSAPLDDTASCGANLEYSQLFLSLQAAVGGLPERRYGSLRMLRGAPDWTTVRKLALRLMTRSRDLRLAVWLTRSLLASHGARGLADGLALVAALLARHWDGVHPQLDPDHRYDPASRLGILATLCQADGMLRELWAAPLVRGRTPGGASLRDIESAPGASAPGTRDQPQLAATMAALESALRQTSRIEQLLAEHVGVTDALDLAPLAALLQRAIDALRPYFPCHPQSDPRRAAKKFTPMARPNAVIARI